LEAVIEIAIAVNYLSYGSLTYRYSLY